MKCLVPATWIFLGLFWLLTSMTGCSDTDEEDGFSHLLKIADGNVLLVHGHVLTDDVQITWVPGDSLRVNGMAVFPPPPVPPKVFSEERLAELYGSAPFVTALVESGFTWAEASRAYCARRAEVCRSIQRVYWQVRQSSGSHGAAAAAVLDSVDRSLLDPQCEPEVTSSAVLIRWKGGRCEELVFLGHGPPSQHQTPRDKLTRERAESETRRLVTWLDGKRTGPHFVLISPRAYAMWGGKSAREALGQTKEAMAGRKTGGPIDEIELDRIISVHRAD